MNNTMTVQSGVVTKYSRILISNARYLILLHNALRVEFLKKVSEPVNVSRLFISVRVSKSNNTVNGITNTIIPPMHRTVRALFSFNIFR